MEPSNTTSSQDTQVNKDTTSHTSVASPPPAYTPRRVFDLSTPTARASRQGLINMAQAIQNPHQQQQTPYATLIDGIASDDQDGSNDAEECSPISLRINASVNVSRSNNIVCLSSTPAEQANAIAKAVVQALNEGSSGRCGIPMIDEDGRPRSLRIEVDAGLVVEGTGNVIGGPEVVGPLLRRRAAQPARRPRNEDGYEPEDPAAKRRRSQ